MIDGKLDRDGVSLHYEVHGEATRGLPLLLTHGYSASAEMWGPNLGSLSAERRVITWDIRGHGRTVTPVDPASFSAEVSVEDMRAILDACRAERAVIGGLSLGGYLSLVFYLAHPERVAALCLFDTGPGFRSPESRARWNAFAAGQAEAFEREGLDALSESPEANLGAHDPVGLSLAARGILTQRDSAVIDSLGSVAVPTLVLVGEQDRSFLAAAEHMATRIPGAVKRVVEGAGHASNIDKPEEFNTIVRAFLESIPPG